MAENSNLKNEIASPPPEPEISIRTMESDFRTIERSGGQVTGSPAPERSFGVGAGEDKRSGVDIPGYAGPEETIFKPSLEAQKIQRQIEDSDSAKWKVMMVIIGIFLVSFSFGLIGYFVIFPWLFRK